MATTKYKVLRDRIIRDEVIAAAGTFVYKAVVYDYGLARDDWAHTGVEHISVSLEETGDYPLMTIPLADVEEVAE